MLKKALFVLGAGVGMAHARNVFVYDTSPAVLHNIERNHEFRVHQDQQGHTVYQMREGSSGDWKNVTPSDSVTYVPGPQDSYTTQRTTMPVVTPALPKGGASASTSASTSSDSKSKSSLSGDDKDAKGGKDGKDSKKDSSSSKSPKSKSGVGSLLAMTATLAGITFACVM
jgi:hypothetical protein